MATSRRLGRISFRTGALGRLLLIAFAGLLAAGPALAQASQPREAADLTPLLPIERVAVFNDAMPTGVAVAPDGRIFAAYPQWGDHPAFSVAELKDGKAVAYPDPTINEADPARPGETLISVQSVVVDAANRLWILDTAAPGFSAPIAGGAKLVAVDLSTNRVVRTIPLGPDVVLPTTYLNDVRFDLRQGADGVAYVTDSSPKGPGAIIVVDLASGKATRRLSGAASTSAEPDFVPTVEGRWLMMRPAGGSPAPFRVACDGVALSPDGGTLYFSVLSGRHLRAVPTKMLRDLSVGEDPLAEAVVDLGLKGASDGLAVDDAGRVYGGDYEHDGIRRLANGHWQTIARDPRILWPDTLSIGTDGYLYFTANQLERQPGFHEGRDLRVKPYELLRIRIDAGPVRLGR